MCRITFKYSPQLCTFQKTIEFEATKNGVYNSCWRTKYKEGKNLFRVTTPTSLFMCRITVCYMLFIISVFNPRTPKVPPNIGNYRHSIQLICKYHIRFRCVPLAIFEGRQQHSTFFKCFFCRPITSSKMYKPSANDTYEGGSIDKYSPRKSNTVLPQIIANGLLCPHNSKGNNYQNTPNGKVSPTLLNPLKSPQIASGSATKSPPYPLPQIPSETNNGPLHLSRFEHTNQQQNTGSNILSNKFHGKRNSSIGQKQLQLIPKDSKNSSELFRR